MSFLLIKPHIVLMFFIALIIWVIRQKRWGMFIGLGTAIFAGTGLMIAFSPNAFDEFASVFDRLAIYPTPTLMNLLRDKFMHWKYPELAYLPALFLAPLTAMWVFRKSSEWSWKWTVSPLLVFSILAAPYTWHHDWIVLLPVILSIFVALRFHKHWITYLVVILLILAQFVLLIQAIVWPSYTIGGFWFPFLLAGIYYVSLKYQHAVPTK